MYYLNLEISRLQGVTTHATRMVYHVLYMISKVAACKLRRISVMQLIQYTYEIVLTGQIQSFLAQFTEQIILTKAIPDSTPWQCCICHFGHRLQSNHQLTYLRDHCPRVWNWKWWTHCQVSWESFSRMEMSWFSAGLELFTKQL